MKYIIIKLYITINIKVLMLCNITYEYRFLNQKFYIFYYLGRIILILLYQEGRIISIYIGATQTFGIPL